MATVDMDPRPLTRERIQSVKDLLPETDGEPLETSWHRAEINLLIDSLSWHWRRRRNFYVAGNMFIHFSLKQATAKDTKKKKRYRGPDFFVVKDVDGSYEREYWWVFEEDNKFPNVIVELLSRSTAHLDRTTKKKLYEQEFRTPEYFLYDPVEVDLAGWRLVHGKYQKIVPENGMLWSEELELWLGISERSYLQKKGTWLRFFDADRKLVPTQAEAQEQELKKRERAIERQAREIARLKAKLAQKNQVSDKNDRSKSD